MKFWLSISIAALSAFAAPIAVSSYSMNNGHGQASSGSFNYWDKNYTGSGSTTTDNAPLSGGVGDLTDGYVETQNWFAVENGAGTGPYVGWRRGVLPDLQIVFNFGSLSALSSVTLYLDDSDGAGGVSLPASVDVTVSGTTISQVIGELPGSNPKAIVVALGGLTGSSATVKFNYMNEWIFMSEVSFDGRTAVPEPSTFAFLALPLAAMAWRRARR